MTRVANDRIASRAAEKARERAVAEGAEAARAWLSAGPVKVGMRIRLTKGERRALKGGVR